MSRAKPITIVGGGLAGLTLGIALRRLDVPVAIHEAGQYPRHRVCGEFISGQGQASLARLGLTELLDTAGAVRAETAALFTSSRASPRLPLPNHASCVSRYALDQTLSSHFQKLGGDLIVGRRLTIQVLPEGTVRASGRRPEEVPGATRWLGLKIHARNVPLTADLEMHFSPGGYVGLCRLAGDQVNICGLFRRPTGPAGSAEVRALLRGAKDSLLAQRLAEASFDEARSAPSPAFPCARFQRSTAPRFASATPSP